MDVRTLDGYLERAGTSYHEERVHRRLVMQPVGQPLHTFVSKKELVGAIIDIVKGMQHFFTLHCGIRLTMHSSTQIFL